MIFVGISILVRDRNSNFSVFIWRELVKTSKESLTGLIEGPGSAYDIANRKMIFNARITLNIKKRPGIEQENKTYQERGFMMSKSSKNDLKLLREPCREDRFRKLLILFERDYLTILIFVSNRSLSDDQSKTFLHWTYNSFVCESKIRCTIKEKWLIFH